MKPTIIVTGQPRSGTSMMMNMLEEGGISCSYRVLKVMNNLRNYNGNFEGGIIPPEGGVAVKRLGGAAITLPEGNYYFINMDRPVNEIVSSWADVNNKNIEPPVGQVDKINREKERLATFLVDKKCISFNYNDLVKNPDTELARLTEFLPYPFDVDKAKAVINVDQYVDRTNAIAVPAVESTVITTPQVIPDETPKTPEQIAMEALVATLVASRDAHIEIVNEQIRRVKKNFEDTKTTLVDGQPITPTVDLSAVVPPVINTDPIAPVTQPVV